MAALRDPKLETFASALLGNIAAGMPRSKAAELAAETAGYRGKSLASNARKRAQRADVKKRMAELAAPALARAETLVAATVEWAANKLVSIAAIELGETAVEVPHQIAALKLLAQIKGWLAPEKRDVTVHDADRISDDELARIASGSGGGAPTAPSDP